MIGLGRTAALLGSSGAGKSTLVNVLLGAVTEIASIKRSQAVRCRWRVVSWSVQGFITM